MKNLVLNTSALNITFLTKKYKNINKNYRNNMDWNTNINNYALTKIRNLDLWLLRCK